METLKSFGAVKQSERGIVLSLGETYWTAVRGSSLGASAETKVKNLANIISNNSDFRVSIEAHTDNRGTPEELLSLTQDRANTISTRFSLNGVEQSRIEARGFGAQLPVMPNTTNANRAKNRRIEIILTPILE
jgi:outer membrane protein OmpA-like peptidoglycan-associated protein